MLCLWEYNYTCFFHASGIYSFSSLCSIPLHDQITVHLPILLSMGMWMASGLGTSWSNAALTIVVPVLLCWDTPRSAAAQSQDIWECLALAGTTTEFSRVTTCLALHERISSALDAQYLWQHLMRTLRKPSGHPVIKLPPLLPFPEASGRTTHLESIYVGFFTFTVKGHNLTYPWVWILASLRFLRCILRQWVCVAFWVIYSSHAEWEL